MSDNKTRVWNVWTGLLSPEAQAGQERFRRKPVPPVPDARWYVVTYGNTPEPRVESVITLDELTSYLRTLPKDVTAAIVYGIQALHGFAPGSSDMRYLLHPDGREPIPLFDTKPDIVINEHGYMGDPDPGMPESTQSTLTLMQQNLGSTQPNAYAEENSPDEFTDEFADEFDAGLDEDDPELGDNGF